MNAILREEKQLGTDPLVHTTRYRYLKINIVIVIEKGYGTTLVTSLIEQRLAEWLNGFSFGAYIQFSDIENEVHSVSGVDQVRIAQSTDDATHYKVQPVVNGVAGSAYTTNFQLFDDELPSLASVTIYRRAGNSFGS